MAHILRSEVATGLSFKFGFDSSSFSLHSLVVAQILCGMQLCLLQDILTSQRSGCIGDARVREGTSVSNGHRPAAKGKKHYSSGNIPVEITWPGQRFLELTWQAGAFARVILISHFCLH